MAVTRPSLCTGLSPESRLVVLESLIDAQLRQGKYREIQTELVMLTAQNPLHEGRSASALARRMVVVLFPPSAFRRNARASAAVVPAPRTGAMASGLMTTVCT